MNENIISILEHPSDSSKIIDLLKDGKSALEIFQQILDLPIITGKLRLPKSKTKVCHLTIPRSQTDKLEVDAEYKAILIKLPKRGL